MAGATPTTVAQGELLTVPMEVLARVGGDRELLAEISRLFVDDAPRHLQKIRHALDTHDGESLRRAAHGLKGAAANFDADAKANASIRAFVSAAGDLQAIAGHLFTTRQWALGSTSDGPLDDARRDPV